MNVNVKTKTQLPKCSFQLVDLLYLGRESPDIRSEGDKLNLRVELLKTRLEVVDDQPCSQYYKCLFVEILIDKVEHAM